MKKILILCLFLLTLSGCQKAKETDPFVKAIKDFEMKNIYGFQYDVIQRFNQQDVHITQTIFKLNIDELKASTTYIEKELAPYEAEELYIETSEHTYFNNNQKGITNGEQISWSPMSIDDYINFELPIITLDLDNLSNVTVFHGEYDFLSGKVKDTSSWVRNDDTIEYIAVEVALDDGVLREIEITIKQVLSTTTVKFVIYKQPQIVSIP